MGISIGLYAGIPLGLCLGLHLGVLLPSCRLGMPLRSRSPSTMPERLPGMPFRKALPGHHPWGCIPESHSGIASRRDFPRSALPEGRFGMAYWNAILDCYSGMPLRSALGESHPGMLIRLVRPESHSRMPPQNTSAYGHYEVHVSFFVYSLPEQHPRGCIPEGPSRSALPEGQSGMALRNAIVDWYPGMPLRSVFGGSVSPDCSSGLSVRNSLPECPQKGLGGWSP